MAVRTHAVSSALVGRPVTEISDRDAGGPPPL